MEGVERVTKLILRFRIVEGLYRGKGHDTEQELETSLTQLYTSILSYLTKAYRYFGRTSTSKPAFPTTRIAVLLYWAAGVC